MDVIVFIFVWTFITTLIITGKLSVSRIQLKKSIGPVWPFTGAPDKAIETDEARKAAEAEVDALLDDPDAILAKYLPKPEVKPPPPNPSRSSEGRGGYPWPRTVIQYQPKLRNPRTYYHKTSTDCWTGHCMNCLQDEWNHERRQLEKYKSFMEAEMARQARYINVRWGVYSGTIETKQEDGSTTNLLDVFVKFGRAWAIDPSAHAYQYNSKLTDLFAPLEGGAVIEFHRPLGRRPGEGTDGTGVGEMVMALLAKVAPGEEQLALEPPKESLEDNLTRRITEAIHAEWGNVPIIAPTPVGPPVADIGGPRKKGTGSSGPR